MSIWADIHRRSKGIQKRKEDEVLEKESKKNLDDLFKNTSKLNAPPTMWYDGKDYMDEEYRDMWKDYCDQWIRDRWKVYDERCDCDDDVRLSGKW